MVLGFPSFLGGRAGCASRRSPDRRLCSAWRFIPLADLSAITFLFWTLLLFVQLVATDISLALWLVGWLSATGVRYLSGVKGVPGRSVSDSRFPGIYLRRTAPAGPSVSTHAVACSRSFGASCFHSFTHCSCRALCNVVEWLLMGFPVS